MHNNRIRPWEIPLCEETNTWMKSKKKKQSSQERLWDHSVGYLSGMRSWGFQITGLRVFPSHISFDQTLPVSCDATKRRGGEFLGSKPSTTTSNPDGSPHHCSSCLMSTVRQEEQWATPAGLLLCFPKSKHIFAAMHHNTSDKLTHLLYLHACMPPFPSDELSAFHHQWQL